MHLIQNTITPVEQKYLESATVHVPDAKAQAKAHEEVLARERLINERRALEKQANPQSGDSVEKPKPSAPGVTVYHAGQTKRNPNYHYIHGKPYDLRQFFKSHPGGADILILTQGLVDSTPLFESYHAMANRPSIMKQLEEYRVVDDEKDQAAYQEDTGLYSFKEDGFYRTLTRRVRAEFGAEGPNADKRSLTKETKANTFWVVKIATQMALSAIFFYLTFFAKGYATWQLCVFAVLAGNFFIQWGFTVMHDASHFAIAPKNHWMNSFMTRVWCAMSLWICRVWMLHHAVMHHAYTGTSELDPDLYHAVPFVRKHPDSPRSDVWRIFRWLGDNFGLFGWALSSAILYAFLPGMWLGQVLMYLGFQMGFYKWKDLWGMKYPDNKAYEIKWYEYALYGLHLASHAYRMNPIVSYVFVVALNISYSMCIVADHDTADAAILNHIDVDIDMPAPGSESNYGKVDWGELQVRNSSNFGNHWFGDIFAFLHGSINYQIEHHLFPGMSHIHLPRIAPIVRKTCEEFNVPYAAYGSLTEAWYSFLVTVKSTMTELSEEKAI